jgi:E3 Ubiquitin ligase
LPCSFELAFYIAPSYDESIFAPFTMPFYGNIDVWLVIGFGFGLVLFFRGLRVFRKSLVVADTPSIPIRSVAMGITQVHGHAAGDTPFPSPVSGTPCYAFRVQIERYVERKGWRHHRTDQNGRRFFLADDSGRIRVDPLEAEFDVPVNCRRQIGGPAVGFSLTNLFKPMAADASDGSDLSVNARTEDELLEYSGIGYDCTDPFRYTEYCIKPDHEYDVLGTCVENPRPEGEDDRNLITKGTHNGTFLISSKSAEQLKQGMGWRSTMMVMGGSGLAVFCAALFMARHGLF